MGKTCSNFGQKNLETMRAYHLVSELDVGSGEQNKIISTYLYKIYTHLLLIYNYTSMHIQILLTELTMSSLPMPMTNITTNTFMKMDNTAIRFLDVVYFLGMAVNEIVMIICTVELYPHIQQTMNFDFF